MGKTITSLRRENTIHFADLFAIDFLQYGRLSCQLATNHCTEKEVQGQSISQWCLCPITIIIRNN